MFELSSYLFILVISKLPQLINVVSSPSFNSSASAPSMYTRGEYQTSFIPTSSFCKLQFTILHNIENTILTFDTWILLFFVAEFFFFSNVHVFTEWKECSYLGMFWFLNHTCWGIFHMNWDSFLLQQSCKSWNNWVNYLQRFFFLILPRTCMQWTFTEFFSDFVIFTHRLYVYVNKPSCWLPRFYPTPSSPQTWRIPTTKPGYSAMLFW